MHDRLEEVRNASDSEGDLLLEEGKGDADTEDLFLEQTQKEFEELSKMTNAIISNTKATVKLETRAQSETTTAQHQEIMSILDKLITSTMFLAKTLNTKLKILKEKNDEYEKENPHSTLAQWRKNKLNASVLRFQKALQEFNAASDSFKVSLRNKIARQAKMVNQDITEEQIEEIVESADPTAFMQQALMIPDAMLDRVAEIERKHEGILNIERGVKELQELWGQLAVLIDEQQEQLDHIEANVDQTLNYVQKGKRELDQANRYQQSARKTACCIIVIGVVIMVVVCMVLFI